MGEHIKGIDFYNLLMESDEFTSELGRVTLASGRLEAELILLLCRNKIKGKFNRPTLGSLIENAFKYGLLSENEVLSFKLISKQRNYLTHNIYALFNYQIEETILEREDLLGSDVSLYVERAWVLNDNLLGLTTIVQKMN
jgi:hypothetical protein